MFKKVYVFTKLPKILFKGKGKMCMFLFVKCKNVDYTVKNGKMIIKV